MTSTDIELFGRKTFFIAPDTSLIPKAYLEEFLTLGYQTFIINDDYSCSLQAKVKEIIRLFPESILYFNIDASVDGIEWRSYIRSLQESIGSETLIGVFYLSRQSPADEEAIKSYYLRDLNVRAGCFALSAHNHSDFDSIHKVLEQSGARGRRSLVRAKCDPSSSVKFEYRGSSFTGTILDVNLSHFRCDLSGGAERFQIFEKIRDASLSINGSSFTSDAVLIMKREGENSSLCIFMFIKRDDSPDLDKDTEKVLNQKIYQIILQEITEKLQSAFRNSAN